MIQGIDRILVLRPDGIGDALNSTPAISALRNAYRDAHISVVLKPSGAEILSLNPHIDEIIIYDPDDLHSGVAAKLRFLSKIRAEGHDMAIILKNSSWCNFISYASGARYRIGRKSERKRFSSTLTDGVRSRDPKGTKHEVYRNMDVARLAGADDGISELVLRLSEDERAWAQDFIHNKGLDQASPLVGIHPGGSSFDKLWPAENFAYVADQLAQNPGTRIILFSGPGEDALADKIRETMTHPPICASGISLRQSAALNERCSLFICNDSGPMHIAAALNVPTVALFGPTDHVRWQPRSEEAVIVRRDMDCWPCSAHKCRKEFECMKSLPVDDVLDAVYSMLDT
ncbi:lipopolysaccharide heptosyltransferase II [Candidatus Poribacteria bacterium]